MSGLLAFMERWKPGSTEGLAAASADQIAALAARHGGSGGLPPVYREFLMTMGASLGGFTMTWGTTLIEDLLKDLEDDERLRPDPTRYLKFAIGEEDENGRHPDDFFDLRRATRDRMDAAVVRIREEDLVGGKVRPEEPFANFSDLIRRVFGNKLGLGLETDRAVLSFDFGRDPAVLGGVFEFLEHLGFAPDELGASRSVMPLEDPERGAFAILRAPTPTISTVSLRLRSRVEKEQGILNELLLDYRKDLMGF